MKHLLFLAITICPALANANPFDGFIGNYTIQSAPSIRNKNASFCDRFGFSRITGIKVEKNTTGAGFKQTHTISLFTKEGYSAHPVMEYEDTNEFRTGGSFAKTTGSATSAANIYGSWNNRQERDTLFVSIEKAGKGYVFNMAEELSVNGSTESGCYYQVSLTR